ncbi:AI-2E family transporter [Acidisphaera sp. L21]|uniref:AI-2E family transporter n=1 Tax=Acidisphaera sp. L21 TaxID=1641851 RepID=UPI00131C4F91|nr:AI-2E family transporter [Acidisphaera sp. L21]
MPEQPPATAIKPIPKLVSQAGAPDASKAMTLFVMIVATLYFGRDVLVPVTLALLLAFILAPLVDLLRRLHLGRVPSVLLGVIVALSIVLAIGGVIGTQIAQLTTDVPKYAATVETKIASVKAYTVGRLSGMANNLGAQRTQAPAQPGSPAAPRIAPTASNPAPVPEAAAQPTTSSPMELAERYLTPVLSPLATFGIVFVVTVFALLQREDLRDRLIRLVGSDDLHRTTLAIDDGGRRLSKFFLFQLGLNTGFGIVVGIGLYFIGVPNPVLWGILSTLLRFVPYVGSAIAALLPMALAAAVEPGWTMLIWTAVLYVGLEGITGQVLEPLLYGHSTGLSPFSVVVAAIFWSWLWGPIGLILSTPLTLCLVVMGRHIKRLQFLDVLLGDRPALTPVESLYQRILADDADEAQDHAELILKERSLSTYYDEVALKGLQLAANDAARGVLDEDQLDRVKATIKVLVEGLKSHHDVHPAPTKSDNEAVAPPQDERELPNNADPEGLEPGEVVPHPWSDPSSILCIAGRGPLDEAAAAMLVQLLGKHGLGGRLVGYGEVSRETIGEVDMTGVAMACVSYLDISGSPAHLRYLMQRLRQRLPSGAPILVGLWPAEDSTLSDKAIQQSIGADIFATSLAGTVTSCVEAAREAAGHSPEPITGPGTKAID